jgi:uncharacterized membrane protein
MRRWPLATLLVVTSSAGLAATGALEAPAHGRPPRDLIDAALHWVATGIEVTGVALIVVSAAAATALFLYEGVVAADWPNAYRHYRANLGRGILLGLELLVAADIIGTVAVTPSFENLAVLGLIVLIRTFLSFSLEVEIDGHWPWRRAELEARRGHGASGPERL